MWVPRCAQSALRRVPGAGAGAGAARRRQAAATTAAVGTDSLQLATAKLPSGVDTSVFNGAMFQWASTLTTAGRNMPFALPLKVDKTADGFDVRAGASRAAASRAPWRREC